MSKTQELIDWLKSPIKHYKAPLERSEREDPFYTHGGHLLDREECDSVVARLEAANLLADELKSLIAFAETELDFHEILDARLAIKQWESLK